MHLYNWHYNTTDIYLQIVRIYDTVSIMKTTCKEHEPILVKTLRGNKLKATPARLSILDLLTHTRAPLSIRDIEVKIKGTIDTATLYRTVEALQAIGLVTLIDFKHGHAHYELSTGQHHHHLICESCGRIVDLSKCDITGLEKQAKKIGNFSKISHHSLELFGLCKQCSR